MNFEILVTNCENNHTTPLYDDYEPLRPRSYTENARDLLVAKNNGAFPFDGVSTGQEVSGTAAYGYTTTRAPLVSRDPQTSSLDRYSPNCHPLYHHSSPKPQKKVPFFSKLKKKTRSKSAHNSPAHSAAQVHPPAYAAVQDFSSCDSEDQIESNLDFGFRGETYCWAGSSESFSDLDGGMTRLSTPNCFRARSLSCSSYSQTDTELSRSSECVARLVSQLCNGGSCTTTCGALRNSCENLIHAATKQIKKSSSYRNTRSKSSGGMIIQKFSKKLSKLSLGGGGGGGKGNEGSGGGLKKKKGRTNSASNLESPDR